MDHLALVRCRQSGGDLSPDANRLRFGQRVLTLKSAAQRLAFQKLHRQVRRPGRRRSIVEHPHDRRMLHQVRRPRFVKEACSDGSAALLFPQTHTLRRRYEGTMQARRLRMSTDGQDVLHRLRSRASCAATRGPPSPRDLTAHQNASIFLVFRIHKMLRLYGCTGCRSIRSRDRSRDPRQHTAAATRMLTKRTGKTNIRSGNSQSDHLSEYRLENAYAKRIQC